MHAVQARDLAERDYAERPGVTVVETAHEVFAGLQRLASESTDLIWA
ncbi:MAG TPA: hypothetical protein VGS06_20140 [Streptosporangiaceae bacterium]|nr:hypothetical protein [Streptosporangiaceae bacterium]